MSGTDSALWAGGISFGGVVAFVFADLVALPLLAVFWATMSLAGLVTEYLFSALGVVPSGPGDGSGGQGMVGQGSVGRDVWGWNHTTVLDVLVLAVLAGLYLLHRRRDRLGAAAPDAQHARYAQDVVCGMQVQVEHAAAQARHDGRTLSFCSDHCHQRFTADPGRFLARAPGGAHRGGRGRRPPRRRLRPQALIIYGTRPEDSSCSTPLTAAGTAEPPPSGASPWPSASP